MSSSAIADKCSSCSVYRVGETRIPADISVDDRMVDMNKRATSIQEQLPISIVRNSLIHGPIYVD